MDGFRDIFNRRGSRPWTLGARGKPSTFVLTNQEGTTNSRSKGKPPIFLTRNSASESATAIDTKRTASAQKQRPQVERTRATQKLQRTEL